jgi:branched-subunit amino acid ABC-type transport system permease component
MSKKLKIFIRTFIEKLPREFYVSGLLSILITSVIIVIFSILNFAIIIVLLSSLVLNILISYPILSKLIKKQYFGINSEKLNIVRDSVLFGNLLSFGVIVVVNLMYIALYSNIPSGETYYWYLRDVTVNSLFSAMVYLEIALGITLVYKILKFANFTQAEYVTFGAYMAFLFGYLAENNGFWSIFDAFSVLKWIPIFIILCVIAFISTAVVGIIFDFIIFKPLRQKDAKPASMMIASFGLGLALRIVIQQIFSAQPLPVSLYFVTIQVDSILLRILIILFVLFSTWFFQLALYTTKLGKIMRAVSDNEDLAKISGVKPYQIHIMVWIISAGFAGVAGVLATSYSVGAPLIDPYIGFGLLLGAFAVTVLGGIGSFEGVVLASLIVGFTENMGAIFLSEFSELNFRFDFPLLGSDFYILPNLTSMLINFSFSTGYKIVLPFAILIIVLLIKPYGLLGEQPSGDR